jgi:desulfoferrodoxin (superoxide reductase-like protein)
MRYLVVLLVAAGITAAAGSVFGHPPDRVSAEFDAETHLLTVAVDHHVKDGVKHFIHRIEVELNGEKVIQQDFLGQPDMQEQEAIYRIADAAVGDKIEVTAECNIFGKKGVEIEVKEKAKPPKKEGEAQQ